MFRTLQFFTDNQYDKPDSLRHNKKTVVLYTAEDGYI